MQENEQPTTTDTAAPSPDLVRDLASDFQTREWIPDALHPYLDWLAGYPLLSAALIVAAGYLVARTILFVITFVLSHLTRRTRSEFDDKLLALLERPLFATIFFGFLGLAVLRLALSDAVTFALLRTLATLALDAPTVETVDDLEWTGPTDALDGVAATLEARDLPRRAAELLASR